MKKNFLTVAAMTVVAFFVSAEIAKAADISFSGQIRTRWEVNEQTGGTAATGGAGTNSRGFNNQPDDFINSSVRLAATANINESTSAFIQMQSNRTWGGTSGTDSGTGKGSGNASSVVNDADSTVGIHQAYFTLKNFMNLPVGFDAKVGRQEIVLDGWRLFGNTIWTMGMQSHDAVRLNHKHDNSQLSLAYILRNEDGRAGDQNDANDHDVYLAHYNQKGVLGGQFSGYYVYSDNGCGGTKRAVTTATNSQGCSSSSDSFHTIGGRQAGNMYGLNYRVEAYYQWGDANEIANKPGLAASGTTATEGTGVDREAYMFGVRVGKKFNNVVYKPSITLFYDYLSGTSDDDQRNKKWKSFDTLYDTGHKFYGLIDVFLGIGGGGQKGTMGLGLQDLAVKASLKPLPGWTLKVHHHHFYTAESINANVATSGVGASGNDDGHFLGTEWDLTAVTKMNSNTKVIIGYSNFNASSSFRALKSTSVGANDANWAYVQFDVKF